MWKARPSSHSASRKQRQAVERTCLQRTRSFAETEHLEVLILQVSNGTSNEQEQAAQALAELALTHENRVALAKLGGISPLVEVLRSESSADGAKTQAASALWNLAFLDANKAEIARAGAISALVALLRSENVSLRVLVAGVMSELGQNEANRAAIVQADGIPGLIRLVKDGGYAEKEYAARALLLFATTDKYKGAIITAGGKSAATALLKVRSQVHRILSARLLRELAADRTKDAKIAKTKLILDLFDLIRSGNGRQCEIAVDLMFTLVSKNADLWRDFFRAGGIKPFLELIRGDNLHLSNAAAKILESMARDSRGRDMFKEPGVIKELVKIFHDRDAPKQTNALMVLTNSYTAFKFVDICGIQTLVELLESDNHTHQVYAARAARSVACYWKSTWDIPEGVIRGLIGLLDADNAAVKDAVVALKYFAQNTSYAALVTQLGGIPRLVALLDASDYSYKVDISEALKNLAKMGSNQDAIRVAGGIALLVKFMRTGRQWDIWRAVKALRVLAENDENKAEIVHTGGVEPLLEQLRYIHKRNSWTHASTAYIYILEDCVEVLNKLADSESVLTPSEQLTIIRAAIPVLRRECYNAPVIRLLTTLSKSDENKALIAREGGYDEIRRIERR